MKRTRVGNGVTRLGLAGDSVGVGSAYSAMATTSARVKPKRRQRYFYGSGEEFGDADEVQTPRQMELRRIAEALWTLKENVESLLLDEAFNKTHGHTTSNGVRSEADKIQRMTRV